MPPQLVECNSDYKITPIIDQSEMYDAVWKNLRNGKLISIFPEGGSHDRTDLLPLKAGVCIMALGCMSKFDIPVNIVTCGLNYYKVESFNSGSSI